MMQNYEPKLELHVYLQSRASFSNTMCQSVPCVGDTEALKRQHRRQDRLKNVRMSTNLASENSQPASDEGVEPSIGSGGQNLSDEIAFDGVFREGVDSDARPAPGEVSLKTFLPNWNGIWPQLAVPGFLGYCFSAAFCAHESLRAVLGSHVFCWQQSILPFMSSVTESRWSFRYGFHFSLRRSINAAHSLRSLPKLGDHALDKLENLTDKTDCCATGSVCGDRDESGQGQAWCVSTHPASSWYCSFRGDPSGTFRHWRIFLWGSAASHSDCASNVKQAVKFLCKDHLIIITMSIT